MSTLCSVVSAASAQLSALLSSLAPREIYYIGGPEPLPAPLTPAEEQSLLARLDTDGAAVRTTLIEHNLRLVVFIARKFDNTGRSGLAIHEILYIVVRVPTLNFITVSQCEYSSISKCIEQVLVFIYRDLSCCRIDICLVQYPTIFRIMYHRTTSKGTEYPPIDICFYIIRISQIRIEGSSIVILCLIEHLQPFSIISKRSLNTIDCSTYGTIIRDLCFTFLTAFSIYQHNT